MITNKFSARLSTQEPIDSQTFGAPGIFLYFSSFDFTIFLPKSWWSLKKKKKVFASIRLWFHHFSLKIIKISKKQGIHLESIFYLPLFVPNNKDNVLKFAINLGEQKVFFPPFPDIGGTCPPVPPHKIGLSV